MLTENGLEVSHEAMEEVLASADVLTVGFLTFPERLLIDFRARGETDTWAGIVAPVATVQERYAWLGRARGGLGMPKAFSFFVWPQSVRSLHERDALATVRARLAAVSPAGARQFDDALAALLARERLAWREAVTGGPAYQALWER
jgi:hypothetical protein